MGQLKNLGSVRQPLSHCLPQCLGKPGAMPCVLVILLICLGLQPPAELHLLVSGRMEVTLVQKKVLDHRLCDSVPVPTTAEEQDGIRSAQAE